VVTVEDRDEVEGGEGEVEECGVEVDEGRVIDHGDHLELAYRREGEEEEGRKGGEGD